MVEYFHCIDLIKLDSFYFCTMEGKLKSERFSKSIASRSRVTKPVTIHCNIDETLTATSCFKIITEIAKYILSNRLIPYPYDILKNVAENLNHVSNKVMVCSLSCILSLITELHSVGG